MVIFPILIRFLLNPQPIKKYNIKIFENQIFFLINVMLATFFLDISLSI